jgi:putative oxidoreductase
VESITFIIGRLLLGSYFIYSGYNHFANLAMMSGYVQSKGIPSPKAAVAFSGILLLIGGLSILLGVYPVVGVAALVAFLIPVTFMMHAFWKVQDPQAKMGEMVNFTKNLALLGAVLLLLAIPEPWATRLF